MTQLVEMGTEVIEVGGRKTRYTVQRLSDYQLVDQFQMIYIFFSYFVLLYLETNTHGACVHATFA